MSSQLQVALGDERRSMRSEVRLAATIVAGPSRRVAATVLNISAHGVMAETRASFVPGRPVTLELAGLAPTAGRIAWTRQGHVGLAFAQPLSVEALLGLF